MARSQNRVRNPGKVVEEVQPISNNTDIPITEADTGDIIIKDEQSIGMEEKKPAEAVPAVSKQITIDPDILIVPGEPKKVVKDLGLIGDRMVQQIYDMFKESEVDAELFEYLKTNASKVVNRVSPADVLFWKAVIARLDKIIDKK